MLIIFVALTLICGWAG